MRGNEKSACKALSLGRPAWWIDWKHCPGPVRFDVLSIAAPIRQASGERRIAGKPKDLDCRINMAGRRYGNIFWNQERCGCG